MVEVLNTTEEVNKVVSAAIDSVREKFGEKSLKEDNFEYVQTYDDGQAIIIRAVTEDDDKRTLKVDVNDTTIVAPPIKGKLNIFKEAGEDEEPEEIEETEED